LPIRVISFLLAGLFLGFAFPKSETVNLLYLSGTYFPKTVVTFAAFLIFNLLAGAMAKLMLFHKDKAGKMFGLIFSMYIIMGGVSLVYVTGWIHYLSDLPMTLEGVEMPGPMAWIIQIGKTFAGVLTQQPLMQALLGAMVVGWATAKYSCLHRVAYGFITVGDMILRFFKKIIWYYPIMIGCLAIGIPMKFGSKGMLLYGQASMWVALVTCIWVVCMFILTKVCTKRSFKQILSYHGVVWPTGFGTGGSYDTLAVNIISAERDLGLSKEVAEVSIVFGTVLNKSCSTMSVLIVTIAVCKLLGIPLSLTEIVMLIPPVMILGLESPGIPGGAGYFMAPIIAVLLSAPDESVFVTTFVTVFSGLVPMFSTAGNTTSDGVVGCLLEDCFGNLFLHDKKTGETQGAKELEAPLKETANGA
jgi:Na+/H+-dicarboxylate symporter